jgi:hypothetical protein
MRPLLKEAFIAQRPVDEDEVCGALSPIAASKPAMVIIESSSDLDDWKFLRPDQGVNSRPGMATKSLIWYAEPGAISRVDPDDARHGARLSGSHTGLKRKLLT